MSEMERKTEEMGVRERIYKEREWIQGEKGRESESERERGRERDRQR
jgi:hypothetical protein